MKHASVHRQHSIRVAAGGSIQVIAQITSLLMGVFLMAYLTRNLGVAGYGQYSVAIQLMNWVGIFMNIATSGVTIRLVAGYESGRAYAVTLLRWAALSAMLLAGILFPGAGHIARLLNSAEIASLIQILTFSLLLAPQISIHCGILVSHKRVVFASALNVGSAVIQLLAAYLFIEAGMAGTGACLAIVSTQLIMCTIARLASGVSMFEHTTIGFGELWRQARLILGTRVSLQISHGLDLLALKFITGDATAAGWYAGARNIATSSAMLFGPSTGAVQQSLTHDHRLNRVDQAAYLANFYARVALVYAGLLASLSVLSGDIIVFLLGPTFSSAAPVLAILLFMAGFRILSITGNTLMGATGDRKKTVAYLATAVPLTLCGYAFFIPQLGMTGAALVAMATAGLLATILIRHGLRCLSARFPVRTLGRVAMAAIMTALLAWMLPGHPEWVIAKLAVASIFYLVMLRMLREWTSTRATLAFFAQSFGSHFGSGDKSA